MHIYIYTHIIYTYRILVPPELSTSFGVKSGGLSNVRNIFATQYRWFTLFSQEFYYTVQGHLMSFRVLIDYGQGKCMEVHWGGLKFNPKD